VSNQDKLIRIAEFLEGRADCYDRLPGRSAISVIQSDVLRDVAEAIRRCSTESGNGCPECGGPHKHSGNPPGCGE